MVTVKLDGVEIEIDIIQTIVSATTQFGIFSRKGIIRYLKGDITLVSSNLYALQIGTEIQIDGNELTAAPLLKPYPDGTTVFINSGFSVTGIYDSFGQTEVGSSLASSRIKYNITSDADPKLNKDHNLICFGSPSSNWISKEIYRLLNSVVESHFNWGEGYNTFTLSDTSYNRGDQGVILFHDSPWNRNNKVLILAGIGPMGTLGCCKAVSDWNYFAVSKEQRKSDSFICAIQFNPAMSKFTNPVILGFKLL